MPVDYARLKACRSFAARAGYSCGLTFLLFLFGSKALQNAVAEGETRTISMHHIHTGEDITITYKRDGRYDEAALEKLNWFLRDWRRSEQTRMDPHLIDLVWEVQRESGSKEPIWVVCGYRSPATNAMLRRRSSGVARFSQHMLGHAMDFYIPSVPLEQLRVIGLRLQRGGVGFYPSSGSPFVHMDTGGVRMWPRMTRVQLLHIFPDGRTAYIPSDGRPLPGYALALADIRKRGNGLPVAPTNLARNDNTNTIAKFLVASARDADDEDDDDTAGRVAVPSSLPAPSGADVQSPALDALRAALERAAERKREAAHLAAPSPDGAVSVASAAAQPKLYHTASFESEPSRKVPASAVAALTPNQIIIARGYWAGPPDGAIAAQSTKPRSVGVEPHKQTATLAPEATGALSPWSAASEEDRFAPELALAYAAAPEADITGSALAPTAVSPGRSTAQAALPAPPDATTIAVKRAANQRTSTIVAPARPKVAAAAPGAQVDDPWLAAMVLSPSARTYLTTMQLGAQDFRALAPLMEKPTSTIMMTFSADPYPGLTSDRFSGSAVVFLPTVTYESPTRSASLH